MEVLLALGSNLDDPVSQIEKAATVIGEQTGVTLLARASLYSSSPRGPQDQDDYVNSAILIETKLSPVELLSAMQKIEQDFGRIKTRVWGERVIDIDIAFYGQQEVQLTRPDLQIPHREALIRDFVLVPCLELAPDWLLPDGTALRKHLEDCLTHQLTKIDRNLACS
jgi:2-amino-4-hydroxy-6-hydroxymethyldihydropteridine diphosphokinase